MFDNIIEKLFENLMEAMPFFFVRSYERACRWRKFGQDPMELGPGFHWRIYGYHSYEKVIISDDVLVTPVQSVITKDEKLVCFKAVVQFKVFDAVKHFCEVNDFHESTIGVAQGHLAKKVRSMTLSELTSDLTKVEKSLEGTLSTRLRAWGTKVDSVEFTDFAEVPTQVRIFGSEHIASAV